MVAWPLRKPPRREPTAAASGTSRTRGLPARQVGLGVVEVDLHGGCVDVRGCKMTGSPEFVDSAAKPDLLPIQPLA
jgi:hypothetical protein